MYAEDNLSRMCRVRVNLENLVFDAVQSRLEIRLLIRPAGTGGQVQANKTCVCNGWPT